MDAEHVTKTVTPNQLAVEFLIALRQTLDAAQYREACVRNANETNPSICHSHDFCDANMVMLGACRACGLDDPDIDDDATLALWGAAWNRAVAAMVRDVPARCPHVRVGFRCQLAANHAGPHDHLGDDISWPNEQPTTNTTNQGDNQ